MHRTIGLYFLWALTLVLSSSDGTAFAQPLGRLEGVVTLSNNAAPVHNATVMVVEISEIAETDDEGRYFFRLPPGTYSVIAYTNSLSAPSETIQIVSGETVALDFQLAIVPLKHEITVTAQDFQQTAFEAVQSVTSLDAADLTKRHATGLGDVLDGAPGVAKRSFGPGSSRPVIRGFDGDRVLVMEDGVRVGSLASQSGDHSEPLDSTGLERVEILKGPATLLYGSNAVGGVVNAVSGHHEIHTQPHQGTRGRVSGVVGSGNEHLGAGISAQHGVRDWLLWGAGGGQRSGDYSTPEGTVENSRSRISNARTGLGYFGDKAFASLGYGFNEGRYGIPFAAQLSGHGEGDLEAVDLVFRRHAIRFTGGVRELAGSIESFKLSLNYSDWGHEELEVLRGGSEEVGTVFENRQFV